MKRAAIICGFFLVVLAAFLILSPVTSPVIAAPQARYVAKSGANFIISPTPPHILIPNSCLDGSKPCFTIDHAVQRANGGDTILVDCGLYEEAGTVVIEKDLTISSQFAGNQCVVITATTGRVLDISNNAEVTLFNLQVSGGDAGNGNGGGIRIQAGSAATLNSVTVRDSTAEAGGGIFSLGNLTLLNSQVRGNQATERGGGLRIREGSSLLMDNTDVVQNEADLGGGIYNTGPVEIRNNSTVSNNEAVRNGGGIITGAPLIIKDSTVAENVAGDEAGGIRVRAEGSLLLDDTNVRSNLAADGGGLYLLGPAIIRNGSHVSINTATEISGGIYSENLLSLIDSSVVGNISPQVGGINNESGTLVITGSSISNNTASATCCGGLLHRRGSLTIHTSTLSQNSAGSHSGGLGIDSFAAAVTINDSTISENSASNSAGISFGGSQLFMSGTTISGNTSTGTTGGLSGGGEIIHIFNTTISGNSATEGGGLLNSAEQMTLEHVTIAFNTAAEGAGIYHNSSSSLSVSNSIVAQNTGPDCNIESGSQFSAVFANLDGDGSCPGFSTGPAFLGPLADNGGPTQTHLPGATSPANDAAENSVCAKLGYADQRGYFRGNIDGNGIPGDGNACDLGAVERGAALIAGPPVFLPITAR